MPSLSVFDLLALHDFVADLPSRWLHRLALAGRPAFFTAGHRLCREDADADRFWLVHSGAVAVDFHVPGRGDIVVERIGTGSLEGWSWMRPPFRCRFGAVVAEQVHAVEFDAGRVRELIADDAGLGRELTARMHDVVSDRLQAARHRLIELYAYPGSPAP
ncbi:cyclic nucleotide-binding domain-containing protein [Actinoplanes oblitus]|uniref:Cyclic nucleotide-binding domain-containing protein n=1 Tax=Actinoplanes oblitus TaxID=3040509 RepID=A0ABY8WRP7_9ACTN|nr:cyclic nucleotide-binding domain-containing protein [Actinoplanes oblitus]WIN00128.1 cyclic nucleotide-binding domain-containing protein [Actinoplanes oblitus]